MSRGPTTTPCRAPRRGLTAALGALLAAAFLGAGCTDSDIARGCKAYCKCHHGARSPGACRASCEKTLTALKKRDRTRARQVADCLAAKGERSCAELALCARGAFE